MMINDQWEMGSSFHHCSEPYADAQNYQSVLNTAELYMSGRYALLDLVIYQHTYHALSKIFIPSYYCHDITRLISKVVDVEIYYCDPLSSVDLTLFPDNSTIILVEYFGNKAEVNGQKKDLTLILDKTHNPFSAHDYNFSIDYTFGSLRKVLPISDGGFLTPPVSPSNLKSRKNISELKDAQKAMRLKQLFLAGHDIDKSEFLNYFGNFENFLNLSDNIFPISAESYEIIFSVDYAKILLLKSKNLRYLKNYYKNNKNLKLFLNDCYFSFFVEPENFDRVKAALIEAKIYPAILWPSYNGSYNLINGHILVSLHADFRYGLEDLKILTYIVDGIFCDL